MFQLLLIIIYLAFISLGLPDALLGSAWPDMYRQFDVPLSYSGGVFMLISAGTVLSSLMSDRVTRRFGTGKVTAFSVLLTAITMFGFSISQSYWMLCLWAVPYGMGAGSVDAALNNYVAIHYASRHMSWLHCMWGVGASIGPWIMGLALSGGRTWTGGYQSVAFIQIILTLIVFLSLPLWNHQTYARVALREESETEQSPVRMRSLFKVPGVLGILACFFVYCAIEQSCNLWASSFLALHHGLKAELAASLSALFFIGITSGRFLSGLISIKLNDRQMVRLGAAIIAVGVCCLFIPLGSMSAYIGLTVVGLGCAPIFPSLIHATPDNFGAGRSQAIIGMQMAAAYAGTCLMPALCGFLGNLFGIGIFPYFLVIMLLLLCLLHERSLTRIDRERAQLQR